MGVLRSNGETSPSHNSDCKMKALVVSFALMALIASANALDLNFREGMHNTAKAQAKMQSGMHAQDTQDHKEALGIRMATSGGAHYLGADTMTQGNWLGKYGTGGGIIFGNPTIDVDHSQPIQIVNNQYARIEGIVMNIQDPRALLMPSNNPSNPHRMLGYITNSTSTDGQINPLQLNMRFRGTQDQSFRVAIYICDWERMRDDMQAFGYSYGYDMPSEANVALYDREVLPTEGVNAGEGVWLVYHVPPRSLFTFLLDNLNGDFETVVSAIMLDPPNKVCVD